MSSNLAIENRKHIFQELNGQVMKQKRDTERTKWFVQPWMFDYQPRMCLEMSQKAPIIAIQGKSKGQWSP